MCGCFVGRSMGYRVMSFGVCSHFVSCGMLGIVSAVCTGGFVGANMLGSVRSGVAGTLVCSSGVVSLIPLCALLGLGGR